MNYGKRSTIPSLRKWKNRNSTMSSDQSSQESGPPCKRDARNLSEKKRRDQFNVLILELCSMVSSTRSSKMDKSTILKATINFLKQHNEMTNRTEGNTIKESWKPSFLSDDEFSQLMLEALDGFVIVYSQQGHILYASESIISLLRHLPKELQSSTIYELIHEDDRPEISKILMEADSKNKDRAHLRDKKYTFTCRMRKGSLEPDRQVQYETVKFNGNFSFFESNPDNLPEGEEGSRCCFVATACLQNTQLFREMTSTEKEKEFSSRHSLDWKFLFLDHRGPPVLGYLPFEVLGTSVYEYYHQDDLEKLTQCHEALMQTGEEMSCYYRYLSKGQEWIWLQTRYYITYNQWNSKPEFIVCTHRVVNYAEVRKGFSQEMAFSDDASMSDSFASYWNSNRDRMSEGSSSVHSSSSEEQSNHSRRGIMLDKIYKPSRKRGKTSNDSNQADRPGRAEVSNAGSVATPSVSSVANNANLTTMSSSLQAPRMSSAPQAPSNGEHGPVSGQLGLIQVKLQKQLMTRHQKLQEDIMRQQHELQHVQQQLLRAQELIFRQSPFLGGGMALRQRQEAPTPGGNWNSRAVLDLPSATEGRSMNLPLQHSPSVDHQSPPSSTAGLLPYPSYSTAPAPQPSQQQLQYHMVQSPAPAPTLQGNPYPSSSVTHRDVEERLAFPDIISNLRSNQNQGATNHLLRFDPAQNSVVAMLPGHSQPTPVGTDYSHTMMGGQDQESGGFLNPGGGLCDDLELDPSMMPGFMEWGS